MNDFHASLLILAAIAFFAHQPALAITINTVPIGSPGNANDPATGNIIGRVNYNYRIGRTEVTVGQYIAFLNAVAKTDTYALYDPWMTTQTETAGISRSGASGSYSYAAIGSANHPITAVSWGDAARFANWLHNGQPTGLQNASTTERGAYALNGAVTDAALNTVSRNTGAKWFIPTENEWYKAAYHKNNGVTGNYWAYPTSTNSPPNSDQPPGNASIRTNVANYNRNDDLANGYNDGFAVSGSTSYPRGKNALTDVGAYTSSPSPYGTFDQGGNVYEWNETFFSGAGGERGVRGGFWFSTYFVATNDAPELRSSYRGNALPSYNFNGFRVATVPGLAGDYNSNGIVDTADYTLWRNTLGQTGFGLAADGSGNNVIDAADYNTWRANFGRTAASASTASASAQSAAPEPSTLSLMLLAAAGAIARKRARHSRPLTQTCSVKGNQVSSRTCIHPSRRSIR